jgi:hypothetical protein
LWECLLQLPLLLLLLRRWLLLLLVFLRGGRGRGTAHEQIPPQCLPSSTRAAGGGEAKTKTNWRQQLEHSMQHWSSQSQCDEYCR